MGSMQEDDGKLLNIEKDLGFRQLDDNSKQQSLRERQSSEYYVN